MEDLIVLIRSISVSRLKSSGLWSFIFEKGSLTEQLCDAINDGRIASDEDAVALLYSGEPVGSKFINLRGRLKERILAVIFLLEFKINTGSNRQNAYCDCNRKWAAAMLLMSKNAKSVRVGTASSL